MATNYEFPVDELIAPANPTTPMANAIIAGQAAQLPTRSVANINAPYPDEELTNLSGQPELWASLKYCCHSKPFWSIRPGRENDVCSSLMRRKI